MNTRELAAQLFLDAVNGALITADQARQIAISSWEMARIFDAQDPQAKIPQEAQASFEGNMNRKMSGCRACYGSGGKKRSCKVCHGTGKVQAEAA